MSSLMAPVLTSALVSGVVTVSINWLGAPAIEDRKERWLEPRRQRRTFGGSLLRMRMITDTRKNYEVPPGVTDEVQERLDAEIARAGEQVDALTQQMFDSVEIAFFFHSMRIPGLG